MATATTKSIKVTVALSDICDRLSDVAYNRLALDAYIRQGAGDVLRKLEGIEQDVFNNVTYLPETRHEALDLLIALEGGLSGTDNRTYGVDRAKVTPLIEDMLRAIVLGNVKFDTEA